MDPQVYAIWKRAWGTLSSTYWLILLLSLAVTLVCPNQSIQAKDRNAAVTAPGAQLKQLDDGFAFTEGPSADRQGNVYFTDQPNDRIVRWDANDGSFTDWFKPAGRSNGTFFDRDGNLLTCADEENELWSISPDKRVKILLEGFGGKRLNGPNDLWIRPDGGIYFTDPLYPRNYWERDPRMQQDGQYVYFLAKGATSPRPVDTDLQQPNGIIGTPDGRTLYIADIGGQKTFAYDIRPDGSLANKRLFIAMGSDGMTIDNEGNVYLTGKGITVVSATGEEVETISVPVAWTANVTFGGKDNDLLFITASNSVFIIEMRTRGVSPF